MHPATRFHHWRSSRYLRISPLHLEFQSPLCSSSRPVHPAIPRLSRGFSQDAWPTAYVLFKPSDSEQRSPPSYYRGCWHEVSRGFLWVRSAPRRISAVCFRTPDSGLHPERLHPTRGVAPSGLRPLRKIRYCSPPWGSGQCLSPNVPGQPLSPGTRRSLGKPLPYQQADGTWAAPRPLGPKVPTFDQQHRSAIGHIRYYQPFR